MFLATAEEHRKHLAYAFEHGRLDDWPIRVRRMQKKIHQSQEFPAACLHLAVIRQFGRTDFWMEDIRNGNF